MQHRLFHTTCAIAAIVAPISVPQADAATTNFSDISKYPLETQQDILNLVELGIIKGTSPTTFSPKEPISRGQVVRMLGRFLVNSGIATVPTNWETKPYFTDLPVNSKDRELLKYAAVVKASGVFNGKPDGSLASYEKITRENMALVLDRATEAMCGSSLVEMANNEQGNVADLDRERAETQDAVNALNVLGISNVANFNPKGNVLRVHFASFLTRAIPFMTAAESTFILTARDYGFSNFTEITNMDETTFNVDFSPTLITISGKFTQKDVNTFIDSLNIKGKDLFGNEHFVRIPFVLNENAQLKLFNEKNTLTETIPAEAFLMDSFTNVTVTSAKGEVISTNGNHSSGYIIKKDPAVNEILELTLTGIRNNVSVTETVHYYIDFAGNIVFDQSANNHSLNTHYYIAKSGDVFLGGSRVNQTFYYLPVTTNSNWTYTTFPNATTIEENLAFFQTNGTKENFDFSKSQTVLIIDENKNIYGVLDLSDENGFFKEYSFTLKTPTNLTIQDMYAFGDVKLTQQTNGNILATATGDEVEGTIVLIIDPAENEHYFEILKTSNGYELSPYNEELFYK